MNYYKHLVSLAQCRLQSEKYLGCVDAVAQSIMEEPVFSAWIDGDPTKTKATQFERINEARDLVQYSKMTLGQ